MQLFSTQKAVPSRDAGSSVRADSVPRVEPKMQIAPGGTLQLKKPPTIVRRCTKNKLFLLDKTQKKLWASIHHSFANCWPLLTLLAGHNLLCTYLQDLCVLFLKLGAVKVFFGSVGPREVVALLAKAFVTATAEAQTGNRLALKT